MNANPYPQFEMGFWSAISGVLALLDARDAHEVNKLDLYKEIQKLRPAVRGESNAQ